MQSSAHTHTHTHFLSLKLHAHPCGAFSAFRTLLRAIARHCQNKTERVLIWRHNRLQILFSGVLSQGQIVLLRQEPVWVHNRNVSPRPCVMLHSQRRSLLCLGHRFHSFLNSCAQWSALLPQRFSTDKVKPCSRSQITPSVIC